MVTSRALIAFRIVLVAALTCIGAIAISTFGAASVQADPLPDNRGYEKVSPNENNDGNVYSPAPVELGNPVDYDPLPFIAAADGNALAYMGDPSEKGGGGHEGSHGGNQYLATHGPAGGWTTVNVTPHSENFYDMPLYEGFSENLSMGYVVSKSATPLTAGAPSGGYSVPYVRNFATGSYESLLSVTPPTRSPEEFGAYPWPAPAQIAQHYPIFGGASRDFSHVLYEANDALTPNAVAGGLTEDNLYDYHEGGLALVNVLPDGSGEPNATFGGPTVAPDSPRKNGPALANAISEDGSRIFWTGLGAHHNLYLREDDERTVQVDASVGGEGQFWWATPDGSKALFTKEGDLFEYDAEDHQATDLVPGAEVQGVVGASRDMSYVYFVALGTLAPGAESGEYNLYVIHGETVKLVGVLQAEDNKALPNGSGAGTAGPWQASPGAREAQVSPDGLHLVFGTRASLTGYDNVYVNNAAFEKYEDEEIYIYDYEGSKLTCVSCNPTGEPPAHPFYAAYLPISHITAYSHRWMSEDGDQVFFDSLDALVPQDTNGLNDVYEWERDGSDECVQVDGCIYMLTGGVGDEGSFMIDSSVNGDDVFFTTRAKLVAEDENENIDAYDARVDASIPPNPPACSGTGCQGVPSAPPVFATPASVTYEGVGNFAASPSTTTAKTKAMAHKKNKTRKRSKKKKRVKGKRATRGRRRVSARAHNGHGRSK